MNLGTWALTGIGRLSRHALICLLAPTVALTAIGHVDKAHGGDKIQRVSGDGELLIIRREAQTETDEVADAATETAELPAYVVEVSDATWREFVGELADGIIEYESLERRLPGRSNTLPAVHFHRKYFDIAKDYQGPAVGAGLAILVAHHPCTGKLMRAAVVLPAGAPTIVYREMCITYVYEDRRIVFGFDPAGRCGINVIKKDGVGVRTKFQRFDTGIRTVGSRIRSGLHQTPLTESVRSNARLVKDTAVGAVGTALTIASMVVDKVGQAAEAVPGVKTLRSAGERAGQGDGQIEELRQSGLKTARDVQQFRRTPR